MKLFLAIVFIGLVAKINCNRDARMHEWNLYKVNNDFRIYFNWKFSNEEFSTITIFFFQANYSKVYHNRFDDHRHMHIFLLRKNEIATHNRKYERGLVSYRLELNAFSDFSRYETVSRIKGLRHSFGRK